MVSRRASLDANQARWQFLKERNDVATLQLAANNHLPGGINAVHLEDPLGNVETDCRDRLHGQLVLNRGSLNSAYIHGTYVPWMRTAPPPYLDGLRAQPHAAVSAFTGRVN
jgi:hypothetical protein